jgi:hypothetical protein
MSTTTTPRSDAVLKNLPKERQHEIHLRRTEGKPEERSLEAILTWLRADGVKVSRRALSEFLSWYSARQDLQDTSDLLETFDEFTRKTNPTWSADKVRDVSIQFLMAHTAAQKDVYQFATVAQLDQSERFGRTKAQLDERKVKVSEGRLELLKAKAAQADNARGILSNKELTEQEKKARMHELFGLA